MKHDFSIRDIVGALKTVRGVKNYYSGAQLAHLVDEAREVNAILDALPDPVPVADEWEPCAFSDIREGDRVKVVRDHCETIYKNPVITIYDDHGGRHFRTTNYAVADEVTDDMTFFRIPAPVQHPDPTVFSAIYVKDCDVVGFVPKIMVWFREAYVAGHQCLAPERITDWEPVKFDPVGDA